MIDQVLDPPMVLYHGDRDARGTAVGGIEYDLGSWKGRSITACAVDFVDAIADQRAPAVTAGDSRYVVRLVEAAYESVQRGGLAVSPAPADEPAPR